MMTTNIGKAITEEEFSAVSYKGAHLGEQGAQLLTLEVGDCWAFPIGDRKPASVRTNLNALARRHGRKIETKTRGSNVLVRRAE